MNQTRTKGAQMDTTHQIGQCRISVETERTAQVYSKYPRISETCSCKDCIFFENEVIQKDIRLFKILKNMGVDLTKRTGFDLEGDHCMGESEKYLRSYSGKYPVFGRIGRTQNPNQTTDEEGQVMSVVFYEPENDAYCQYTIRQVTPDQINFEYFLECEKKNN